MKVFQLCPPAFGVGVKRVRDNIGAHAPNGVHFVETPAEADLVIYHVVGVQNMTDTPLDDLIRIIGKPYAIVQYCLRTTEKPTADFWLPLWRGARLVWSYYDLDRWAFDQVGHTFPNFYYAPLGANADVFKPSSDAKRFTIGTSGFVAETEGVAEAYAATRAVRGAMFHLGPDLALGRRVASLVGLSDEAVARLWSECAYVAGLRRVEGFELPTIEGLLCGARPVCFDAPHYRHWLGDFAEYVPEGDFTSVAQALTALFRGPYRPVTTAEIEAAKVRFDWRTFVHGFWERLGVR